MSRLAEYLAYHAESHRIGDIDPSYNMLKYVCDRFELNLEQRYWLAWIYAMTYCGASTFYVYNEFPDFENVDVGRLQRWWDSRGRQEILCQTDRRWVRSMNLFVPAFVSYRQWIDDATQYDHFEHITAGISTPKLAYDRIYQSARGLHSFGQFSLFLYLEALHTITPLDLAPTTLDLNEAWSCRDGLYYALGYDEWLSEDKGPIPAGAEVETEMGWQWVCAALADLQLKSEANVWQIETTLCAYKKFHRGKRYIGYYLDRQALEIAKMQANVPYGVCWDVLWDFRAETLNTDHLVEQRFETRKLAKGLPSVWKASREGRTAALLRLATERAENVARG
jgi:hypothetical protein